MVMADASPVRFGSVRFGSARQSSLGLGSTQLGWLMAKFFTEQCLKKLWARKVDALGWSDAY